MATATAENAAATGEDLALIGMEELESRLDKCRGLIDTEPSAMKRTILIAKAMKIARQYIRGNIKDLAELQGTPLGFCTDKEYAPDELVDALTEAAIVGLPFVGNCVNVISKRLYIPKPGWEHRFREHPQLSWPELHIGEIEMTEDSRWIDLAEDKWYQSNGKTIKQRSVPGMSKVTAWAKCLFRGIEIRVEFFNMETKGGLDERIAIRVNRGMTEDAVKGKAEARLYKALWKLAMGAGPGTADDDDATAADPNTVDATATATSSSRAAPVAEAAPVQSAVSPVASDPEPGSFDEYASLMSRAGSIKVAAEIRGRYMFDGELANRANDCMAARKAELRAQAQGGA